MRRGGRRGEITEGKKKWSLRGEEAERVEDRRKKLRRRGRPGKGIGRRVEVVETGVKMWRRLSM